MGQRLAAEKGTGPVLRGRLDKGHHAPGGMSTHIPHEGSGAGRPGQLRSVVWSGAGGRRGPHPVGGGQGDLGPHAVLAGQGSPVGPAGEGFLCIARVARAIPAPALARPLGVHARHHTDLGAGGARVPRPAALHGARGQSPAGRLPTGLAATRRLVALGRVGKTDPPALGPGG